MSISTVYRKTECPGRLTYWTYQEGKITKNKYETLRFILIFHAVVSDKRRNGLTKNLFSPGKLKTNSYKVWKYREPVNSYTGPQIYGYYNELLIFAVFVERTVFFMHRDVQFIRFKCGRTNRIQ